ncbi:MAG: rhodanese-like domain-containing protein [Eubacteriaceae bacterium]
MKVKKGMKIGIILSIGCLLLVLGGCSQSKGEQVKANFTKISSEEAKEMMDTQKDLVVVDVRTKEEYEGGHIKNAILMPLQEIEALAPEQLKNKEETILVYCRSGQRSAAASGMLASMGYTNVFDFGGINNWQYEVVK